MCFCVKSLNLSTWPNFHWLAWYLPAPQSKYISRESNVDIHMLLWIPAIWLTTQSTNRLTHCVVVTINFYCSLIFFALKTNNKKYCLYIGSRIQILQVLPQISGGGTRQIWTEVKIITYSSGISYAVVAENVMNVACPPQCGPKLIWWNACA